MKKIISCLGLSVLLSFPAWAQEQLPANSASAQAPTMSEEDAQTIFFSEDFLNELTSDTEEVQIFDDIPLDKSAVSENAPTPDAPKVAPETSLKQAQPLPQQPTAPAATQPLPQQPAPAMVESKPAATQPLPQQPTAPAKAEPEVKTLPTASAEKPVQPDTVSKPTPQQDNATADSQPTIQELLQQKAAPVLSPQKETQPAPKPAPKPSSKPKTNAFSLDNKAPISGNFLDDNALETNMLNRGIRISPEQRARMMMKKKYAEMDLNHDGIISKNEFIRYKTAEAQKIAAQVFQQIDTNGDNILSDAEYDYLMDKMIENYINPAQKK